MTHRGSVDLRARVAADGRLQATIGDAVGVLVLAPSQLQARVSRFARTDRPLKIAGRVSPVDGPRHVVLQTSPDGQVWTEVGDPTADATSGQFAVRGGPLAAGQAKVRVLVDATSRAAEVRTRVFSVSVEATKLLESGTWRSSRRSTFCLGSTSRKRRRRFCRVQVGRGETRRGLDPTIAVVSPVRVLAQGG
jgi:hypothetical protein